VKLADVRVKAVPFFWTQRAGLIVAVLTPNHQTTDHGADYFRLPADRQAGHGAGNSSLCYSMSFVVLEGRLWKTQRISLSGITGGEVNLIATSLFQQ